MIRKLLIIILSFIVTSCGKKNSIPNDIIPPVKMEIIFWDMLRADLLAQEIVNKDSTKNIKAESLRLNEQLYHVHHVSKSELKKSLSFYEERPELLRTIFDSLNAAQTRKNLNRLKGGMHGRPVKSFPFDSKPNKE